MSMNVKDNILRLFLLNVCSHKKNNLIWFDFDHKQKKKEIIKYLKVSVEYFVQMQILETNQDLHKIEFRFIFSEFAIL